MATWFVLREQVLGTVEAADLQTAESRAKMLFAGETTLRVQSRASRAVEEDDLRARERARRPSRFDSD